MIKKIDIELMKQKKKKYNIYGLLTTNINNRLIFTLFVANFYRITRCKSPEALRAAKALAGKKSIV